jgi:hypothetical protein
MDGMKNVRSIVPVSTLVADADYYLLQDDEPVFVFERGGKQDLPRFSAGSCWLPLSLADGSTRRVDDVPSGVCWSGEELLVGFLARLSHFLGDRSTPGRL